MVLTSLQHHWLHEIYTSCWFCNFTRLDFSMFSDGSTFSSLQWSCWKLTW
jgi:hypothetical protein